LIIYFGVNWHRLSSMNINLQKKTFTKTNNFTEKGGVVYREPIIQDNGLRNKINIPNNHL
jgi:hypothetical protein